MSGLARARRIASAAVAAALAVAAFVAAPSAHAAVAAPFAFGAPAMTFPTNPYSIAVGDLNADGRQDLVVGHSDGSFGSVNVRLGVGDRTFTDRATAAGMRAVSQIALGDLDGNGTEDVVVADSFGLGSTREVAVLSGVGDGHLAGPTYVDLPGAARDVALGDLGGSDALDLAVATTAGVSVRLGNGSGGFAATGADVTLTGGATVLVVGDVDRNQRLDVAAVTGAFPYKLAVLTNDGAGGFTTQTSDLTACSTGGCTLDLAAGDFDEDGNRDLAGVVYGRSEIELRFGVGNGTFRDDRPDVQVGASPQGLVVGDFDGDGHEDIATADLLDDTVSLRLGNGDGTFRDAGAAAALDRVWGIAAGDFDADGVPDLAVSSAYQRAAQVLRGTSPALLSGNLLVNGGFEQGVGARTPSEAPAISGWTTTGGMTAARYGMIPAPVFPSLLDAPRFDGGRNFLWGGISDATGITTASQTVDVSAHAAAIDGGKAGVNLSARLGGGLAYADHMQVRAVFLDGSGVSTGSAAIGPVTNTDRLQLTTMLPRRVSVATLPAGTRQIRVTLTSTDTDTISSATADNVKLTLVLSPPPTPTTPGTSGTPGGFGAQTLVGVRLAKGKIAAKGPLVVRVSNANAFAVVGSLAGKVSVKAGKRARAVRLRAKAVSVAASASATVKLALPKALQRVLARTRRLTVRLTLIVRDPAGNRRTVGAKLTVRLAARR